jgi:anaerobic magnesium-protoporphyrin IX monomethyl ester cyclase
MKVLLIRPPAVSFKSEPSIILNEPLGLLYLAGYLKKNNKEVALVDGFADSNVFKDGDFYGRGMSYVALAEKIKEFHPDIVGINYAFTQYSKGPHDVARMVKEISNRILVLCGGPAACASVSSVLTDTNFDLLVKGEGEETLLEIVERHEKGLPLTDIPGTAVRMNDEIKINPPRQLIKNLDTLPFPARELVDMSKYYNDSYSVDKGMRYPRLSIITSRGCPFRCIFCSIHSVWEHTYRMRSVGNVVDEIELLSRDFGVKEIIFYDDNLTFDKKRINQICADILKRKINIKWSVPNGVAIWTLDKETIRNMKRAGCYKITFGLESGSRSTLKFIHKDFLDFDQARELIRFCNKIGLWTVSSLIVGFPYETKDDLAETADFAISSDVDMASFYIATPYPGSELYEIYKKEGFVKELDRNSLQEWQGDIGVAVSDTKYLRKDEITSLPEDMKKRFLKKRMLSFLNPLRLLRKATGLDEIKYVFMILRNYSRLIIATVFRSG